MVVHNRVNYCFRKRVYFTGYFLPEYAQDVHIKTIVLMEWLILLSLLVFWIPRIEGNKLETMDSERLNGDTYG